MTLHNEPAPFHIYNSSIIICKVNTCRNGLTPVTIKPFISKKLENRIDLCPSTPVAIPPANCVAESYLRRALMMFLGGNWSKSLNESKSYQCDHKRYPYILAHNADPLCIKHLDAERHWVGEAQISPLRQT